MHALATGNWVGGRSGVSQLLDRTTFLAALSHMRRVTSPLVRSQPHFEARDLHPTQSVSYTHLTLPTILLV